MTQGISDFDVDSNEHHDVVVAVGAEGRLLTALTKLLTRRDIAVHLAPDITALRNCVRRERVDLIVWIDENGKEISSESVIDALAGLVGAGRLPAIVVHSDFAVQEAGGVAADSQTEQLIARFPFPCEPADIFVKATTLLRLKKLEKDNVASHGKVVAQNAKLRDLTGRFQHELREARAIQQAILPQILPSHPQLEFAVNYVPLEAVGGDIYDVVELPGGFWLLFIADVTGHGLPAAFLGAMSKMALSYSTATSPDKLLCDINSGLTKVVPEGRFVTAATAIVNPQTAELAVARAGHPPVYLLRKETGRCELISPRGLPLGVVSAAAYELEIKSLADGDRVYLVTDGLTERINMDGQFLGVEGLESLVANTLDYPLATSLEKIIAGAESFSGGRILKDDITVLGLEYRGILSEDNSVAKAEI